MFSKVGNNCHEPQIITGVNLSLYGRMMLTKYVKVDLFSLICEELK